MLLHSMVSRRRSRVWRRVVVASVLGLVVFAGCRPANQSEKALPADGAPVEPTTEAALRFVEKVSLASRQGIESGQASLTVTQEELTSFLSIGSQISRQLQAVRPLQGSQLTADRLGQLEGIEGLEKWVELAQEREGLPPMRLPSAALRLTFRDAQVRFTGRGEIALLGYLRLLQWQQPVHLMVAPRATRGELVLDFVSGRVGPVRLPEFVFDPLGRELARVVLAGQAFAEITEISVQEGRLTVAGRYGKDTLGL